MLTTTDIAGDVSSALAVDVSHRPCLFCTNGFMYLHFREYYSLAHTSRY